ncbi:MAG: hypothetical protein CMD31_13000 [Flavobacteriales bacterium]|nr:hypothetical protein [Flavobacteriales bacterium]|tara:strand:+ start:28572 stop:29105 length:534 start_codon:yes stop_codon:yes gene_type:complete
MNETISQPKKITAIISTKKANDLYGSIAEILVVNLFQELGFNVHRSGMEYAFPALGNLQKLNADKDIANHIRHYPDFILQRKSDKKVFLAEVKYSSKNTYRLEEQYEKQYGDYPFPGAYIIFIGKTRIVAKKVSEIKDNGNKFNLISDITDFECHTADKIKIIKKYVELAGHIFTTL